mmetsp:Transcript_48977/g.137845  ORF Transcript_48977/g.137845 Transcript_48977/m.137845 type:complete len:291 (+) Transcript_48977:197-1069(+)
MRVPEPHLGQVEGPLHPAGGIDILPAGGGARDQDAMPSAHGASSAHALRSLDGLLNAGGLRRRRRLRPPLRLLLASAVVASRGTLGLFDHVWRPEVGVPQVLCENALGLHLGMSVQAMDRTVGRVVRPRPLLRLAEVEADVHRLALARRTELPQLANSRAGHFLEAAHHNATPTGPPLRCDLLHALQPPVVQGEPVPLAEHNLAGMVPLCLAILVPDLRPPRDYPDRREGRHEQHIVRRRPHRGVARWLGPGARGHGVVHGLLVHLLASLVHQPAVAELRRDSRLGEPDA